MHFYFLFLELHLCSNSRSCEANTKIANFRLWDESARLSLGNTILKGKKAQEEFMQASAMTLYAISFASMSSTSF